jgi:hypothetical protein
VFVIQPTQRFIVTSHTGIIASHALVLVMVHSTHRPALGPAIAHAGVAPEQSVMLAGSHARQTCMLGSQIGVAPPQSAFARQPTHRLALLSQIGVVIVQADAFVSVHSTHCPALGPVTAQAGVAPLQSVTLAGSHARHTCAVASQIGVAPPQSELLTQPTHTLVVVSHAGVGAAQFAGDVHATHRPAFVPVVAHAGVAPEQSVALLVLHGRQTCAVASQIGVAPPQFAFVRQPTQRFCVVSQMGVDPVQAPAEIPVHCTHRPAFVPVTAHAGVAPEQSVRLVVLHARHWRVTVSQIGVVPAQSALVAQPPQTGGVPEHASLPPETVSDVGSRHTSVLP